MPTTQSSPLPAPRAEGWARRCQERATALILVPTLLLVMMSLGGIAIDMSMLHGAHRSVHRTASAAADDAASMIDRAELQVSGQLRIDASAARALAIAEVQSASLPGELVGPVDVVVGDDGATVTVALRVRIGHVMLQAVPGAPDHEVVSVRVTGRLNR